MDIGYLHTRFFNSQDKVCGQLWLERKEVVETDGDTIEKPRSYDCVFMALKSDGKDAEKAVTDAYYAIMNAMSTMNVCVLDGGCEDERQTAEHND